jgi:hypothetical protein
MCAQVDEQRLKHALSRTKGDSRRFQIPEARIPTPRIEMMWQFTTDPKSDEFICAIKERIRALFNVVESEAIAAIHKNWRGVDFQGDPHIFYHETIDYWAKTHFLGKDSGWWLSGEETAAGVLA